MLGFWKACEFGQRWENVNGLDHGMGTFAWVSHARIADDERRSKRFLEEGVFAPDGVFTEVPSVVAPKNDDGILAQIQFVEAIEDTTDLGVSVTHAGSVVLADGERVFGVGIRVEVVTVVFVEFAGLVPSGFPVWFVWVRDNGQFRILVEVQVFLGSSKWQVRTEDAECEEEGFVRFFPGKGIQLLDGIFGVDPVGIDCVRTLECLDQVHLGRVFSDLAMSLAVHPSARVLPETGVEQMAIPGVRHFGNSFVIPVRAATAAGVVRYLANGYGTVAILAEPSRHARWERLRVFGEILGSFEEGGIAGTAIGTGQKRVARSSASGSLNVMLVEGASLRGEFVDVGRFDVVDSEAIKLGPEVIDANQEYIRFFSRR